jgi:hypothetical protein
LYREKVEASTSLGGAKPKRKLGQGEIIVVGVRVRPGGDNHVRVLGVDKGEIIGPVS